MTSARRVSGDRLPSSTSAMRPFSMVTLAPRTGVGLTQSIRVALASTVRGTREAYLNRPWPRVAQPRAPSRPPFRRDRGARARIWGRSTRWIRSVMLQDAKGEVREVPEQGEGAQGREDAHDVGHVLHLVPEMVAGHDRLPDGPHGPPPVGGCRYSSVPIPDESAAKIA